MESAFTSLAVAVLAALSGMFATWGLLRGKRVDAGEWLIDELRKDAVAARKDAESARLDAVAARAEATHARSTMRELEARIVLLETQLAKTVNVDVHTTITSAST